MAPPSTLAGDDAQVLPAVGPRSVAPRRRLAAYAALGGAVDTLPLPWLPESLLRRVRGALVQDVAVGHGVSLTAEARAALAEPAGPDGPRGFGSQALRFVGLRLAARVLSRLGPIALVWPLRQALRTYVLGHLFDRYLERARGESAVRIDLGEARRVRCAIDGALARAITVEGPSAKQSEVIDGTSPAPPGRGQDQDGTSPAPPGRGQDQDEQRNAMSALIDGLIGATAGVPDRLVARLDAAFDDLLRRGDG